MKIQEYKQSTIEGCLASCLLQLRYLKNENKRNKITKNLEQNMLFYALKHCREDFVSGHLDFIEKKLNFATKRYVHNKFLYNLTAKIGKKDLF